MYYGEQIIDVIEHTDDHPLKKSFEQPDYEWGREWVGYTIITTKRKIRLLVDNTSSCCEDWGYISSDDNLSKLVGATLYTIDKTIIQQGNGVLPTFVTKELNYGSVDAGGVAFITLHTDRGNYQFAVYNSHNGYYGHTTLIIIGKLDRTKTYI